MADFDTFEKSYRDWYDKLPPEQKAKRASLLGSFFEAIAAFHYFTNNPKALDQNNPIKRIWTPKALRAEYGEDKFKALGIQQLDIPDKDRGIDLILEHEKGFRSVQAKGYRANRNVGLKDMSSMAVSNTILHGQSGAGLPPCLITSAKSVSRDTIKWLEEKGHPVIPLSRSNLDDVDWPEHIDNLLFPILGKTLDELIVKGEPLDVNATILGLTSRPAAGISRVDSERFTIRQKQAVANTLHHFRNEGATRGQVIHACGTGKSVIAAEVDRCLGDDLPEGAAPSSLVLAPSISLVASLIGTWNRQHGAAAGQEPPFDILAVCSAKDFGDNDFNGENSDREEEGIKSLCERSTDPERIASWLFERRLSGRPAKVFGTYASSKRVAEAQQLLKSWADEGVLPTGIEQLLKSLADEGVLPAGIDADSGWEAAAREAAAFHFAVADESHLTATQSGDTYSTIANLESDARGERKFIDAGYRLFMTATPRILVERLQRKPKTIQAPAENEADDARQRAQEGKQALDELPDGQDFRSQDDETRYGKVFSQFTMREAIDAGEIKDYQVVVMAVDPDDATLPPLVAELLDDAMGLKGPTASKKKIKNGKTSDAEFARMAALYHAMQVYDINSMLAFHGRIGNSKKFVAAFESLKKLVGELPMSMQHVDGKTDSSAVNKAAEALRTAKREMKAMISNVRLMETGNDLVGLDGIAVMDPTQSVVRVVQMIGRCLRQAEGKMGRPATIVLPVVVSKKDSDDQVLQSLDDSAYATINKTLRALAAHDVILAEEINRAAVLSRSLGDTESLVPITKTAFSSENDPLANPEMHRWLRNLVAEWYGKYGELPTAASGNVDLEGVSGPWSWKEIAEFVGQKRFAGLVNAMKRDLEAKAGISSRIRLEGFGKNANEIMAGIRSTVMMRVVKNVSQDKLTIEEIKEWVNIWCRYYGAYPTCSSSNLDWVPGLPKERWSAIDYALKNGTRGLPGGTTLARVVQQVRDDRMQPYKAEEELYRQLLKGQSERSSFGPRPHRYEIDDERFSQLGRVLREKLESERRGQPYKITDDLLMFPLKPVTDIPIEDLDDSMSPQYKAIAPRMPDVPLEDSDIGMSSVQTEIMQDITPATPAITEATTLRTQQSARLANTLRNHSGTESSANDDVSASKPRKASPR